MKYINCEALHDRAPEKRILISFMAWLETQKITLVRSEEKGGYSFYGGTNDEIILDYFGIDQDQLEIERRHILESVRNDSLKP